MIISDDTVLHKRISELKDVLLSQHYPIFVIENGIERALQLNRADLRRVQQKSDENIVTFVSTFNPKNPEIFQTIRHNLDILYEDEIMAHILNCHEIIKSKRQPQNLKRILTKARFDENEQEATITQCGRPNCGLCHHLIIENIYHFKCGKSFKVKSHMSCNVRNLIYVIQCGGCQEEYIGETGDTLRHRLTVHRQQIRNPNVRMLYVSEHISICSRQPGIKFKVFPLYKMRTDSIIARKLKESYFIDLFRPKLNRAL